MSDEHDDRHPLDTALGRVGKRLDNLAREFPPMSRSAINESRPTPLPWRERWIEWAFTLPEDVRKLIIEAQRNIEEGRKGG